MAKPPHQTSVVLLPLVRAALTMSPLAEFKLGLKKAVDLCAGVGKEYTSHHSTTMRVLNEVCMRLCC